MVLNRSLGQYIPRESIIHFLDPRVKLFCVVVFMPLAFILQDYYKISALTFLLLLMLRAGQIPLRYYWQGLKPFIWLLCIIALLQILFIQGQVLLDLGLINISREGMDQAGSFMWRILLVLFLAQWLTFTTTLSDLTKGLEYLLNPLKRIGLPVHELVMIMTIALSFFPILLQEGERIHKAQLSRGADIKNAPWRHKWRIMVSLLVPLFLQSVNRATTLAEAMEIRGYRGGQGRTRLKELRLGSWDYIATLLILITSLSLIFFPGA